jgi:hypothetical protein
MAPVCTLVAKLDQPVIRIWTIHGNKHPRHWLGFEPMTQQSAVQCLTPGPQQPRNILKKDHFAEIRPISLWNPSPFLFIIISCLVSGYSEYSTCYQSPIHLMVIQMADPDPPWYMICIDYYVDAPPAYPSWYKTLTIPLLLWWVLEWRMWIF